MRDERDFDAEMRQVAKAGLRRSMQTMRSTIPRPTRAAHAEAIAKTIVDRSMLENVRRVAVYRAIVAKAEVETAPIVAAARARNVAVAYPTVEDPDFDPRELLAKGLAPPPPSLVFRIVDDTTPFVDRGRGFLEPASGEIAPPESIDVAIVPGLAFDVAGHRVGYGKGFYDRFLATAVRALRVGVAFDLQIVDEVAHDPHDVAMSAVVTERRVVLV